MPEWIPTVEDYLDFAEALLGVRRAAIKGLPRIGLAESRIMARFLDANGLAWAREDVQTDAGMVERIAASDAEHEEIVRWIRGRTT